MNVKITLLISLMAWIHMQSSKVKPKTSVVKTLYCLWPNNIKINIIIIYLYIFWIWEIINQSIKLLANNLRKSYPNEVLKGTFTGWLVSLFKVELVLYLITISVYGSVNLNPFDVSGLVWGENEVF